MGFRGAEEGGDPGEGALVGLGDGLSGGDADACPVVATGAGSDEDEGEFLVRWDLAEDFLEGWEEVGFL